ncbi:MAG: hypothetical protein KDC48_07765 [Planctomycetes bacterium]|nr:hypothetical protein [Planctomycetota bacterium]
MAREPFLLLALAALTGASLWLARGPEHSADATTVSDATATSVEQAAPRGAPTAVTGEIAAPEAAAPAPADVDHSHQLELPDGSFVDALNGATNPKPIAEFWGTQIPWSPIVGVESNDKGVAWYRYYFDDSATTETLWDSAGKRFVTLTRVAHQGPAAPEIAARR